MDVLAEKPWAQAEFLLGLGEWLLLSEGEVHHGRDVLLGAADLLLQIEAPVVELADRPSGTGDMSSRLDEAGVGGRATLEQSGGSKTGPRRSIGSVEGGSKPSGSYRASITESTSISRRTLSPTRSIGSELAVKDLAEVDVDRPDSLSTFHLSLLVRIFCALAASSRSLQERIDFLLTGQVYATRMLQATLAAANARHALRNPDAPSELQALPASLVEYATFQLSREVVATLLDPSGTPAGEKADPLAYISRESIPKPELTLHYLTYIIDQLSHHGYHLHALPVCHVYAAIVDLAMIPPPGSKQDVRPVNQAAVGYLRLATLLDNIGLHGESKRAELLAGVILLTPEEVAAARSEVEQRQIAQAALQERSYGFKRLTGFSPPPTRGGSESGKSGGKDDKKKEQAEGRGFAGLLLMAARAEAADEQRGLGVKNLAPLAYAECWLARAQYLADRGQYGPALEILNETLHVARGFGDDDALVRCHLLLSRLALFTSDAKAALSHVNEVRASCPGPLALPHSLYTILPCARCCPAALYPADCRSLA